MFEIILNKMVGYSRIEVLHVSESRGGATTQPRPHLIGTREACKTGTRPGLLWLRAEGGNRV